MFETRFRPDLYRSSYYSELATESTDGLSDILTTVGQENSSIVRFYALEVLPFVTSMVLPNRYMLEVGGGPTIYQLISLGKIVQGVFFTDYLEDNLQFVKKWIAGDDFFWRPYFSLALKLELGRPAKDSEVVAREGELKSKIRLARYDVLQNIWLDEQANSPDEQFGIVCSNFCIESITDTYNNWFKGLANLSQYVCVGGVLIMVSLSNCKGYQVGSELFPAVSIADQDLRTALGVLGFNQVQIRRNRILRTDQDYDGFVFTIAVKGE